MRVIPTTGPAVELGDVEVNPTIGMTDYSRRVTDDYGATTVVKRGFSRTLSARIALPFDQVSIVQTSLAALRAQIVRWEVDPAYSWLNFDGFFRDFDIDLAVPPLSYCTLSVEGLAETETITDDDSDPAPDGVSSLFAIAPVTITNAEFVTSNVAETDHAAWSAAVTYALGARVIKTSTHRIYESAAAGNVGNDPEGTSGLWIDVGPTNRWAMFDQALGTITTRVNLVTVTIAPGAVNSLAVLDVVANTVRVQVGAYDVTKAVVSGCATFLDLPGTGENITVTILRGGGLIASVGTLVTGFLRKIGDTSASPSAGITDYSRKEVDDFGAVTIVERAWARRMNVSALINSDSIDKVANRIAALRGSPAVWIANEGTGALTIYGFFRDFSIEVGQNVSTLALSVEGLANAPQTIDLSLAGILYKSEKPDMVQRYNAIIAEQSGIGVTADGFDITTEKVTYNAAVTALTSYLTGLSPAFDNYAADTAISRATYNQKFNDVDSARQALLNKIAVTSGERAEWPYVRDSDPNAPVDGATRNTGAMNADGLNAIDAGGPLFVGQLPVAKADSGLVNANVTLTATGGLVGAGGGTLSNISALTAGGIVGQSGWATYATHLPANIAPRVAAGLTSAGDIARNITAARRDSSSLLGRTGGGLFTGELAADVTSTKVAAGFAGQGSLATLSSAPWGTHISGRPAELTDGRVAAGLDTAGAVKKALPASIGSAQSSTVTRPLPRGAKIVVLRDGEAYTFPTPWGSGQVPSVQAYNNGYIDAGNYLDCKALGVTSTGFTADCKKVGPGTLTARTESTAGTATAPRAREIVKALADEAHDDMYKFTFSVVITNEADAEPGIYAPGQATIGLWTFDGATWQLNGTLDVYGNGGSSLTTTLTGVTGSCARDGMGANDRFGLSIESSSAGATITAFTSVKYDTSTGNTVTSATPANFPGIPFLILGGTE